MRNTEDNLELVDALVEQANVSGPKQVEIEAKFVEINQNNLKELGFDWLLGQFNIGNQRVFGGGGTQGTSPPLNPADFPFVAPNNVPIGQFPVTGGNRSGNLAISASAIDALLLGMRRRISSLAPGIFGLSGVFTDPQFQVVIRALNQKKGDRSPFGAARNDQEWAARRHRDCARVSLSDAIYRAESSGHSGPWE